ncbi:MAG: amidohydrolase family protein, partial [Xanthomonadales bacterium]|nr:amidohydrolase family protein [Xanthomonadales bacterium]
GVYSADPKLDPKARKFDKLSYAEALEKNLRVMAPESPPSQGPSETQDVSDSEGVISVYDWHARGTEAGETTVTRAGDGRVTTEAFVHWNNREYTLHSELQLDAEGMVIAQTISGTSPFGAPIDERFSFSDGQAQWQTRGERGNAQRASAAFYVPTEWAAVGSLEALVRAAVNRIDGELPLFPAGTARVEKLTEAEVTGPDGEVTLSLYAISGIDFTPRFGWFDEHLTLAARDLGRMGMVPQGWNPDILEILAKAQGEQSALRAERLSSDLAHRPDGPVLFEHVDVVDVANGRLQADHFVLVENGTIRSVSGERPAVVGAMVIDGRGKTLIPGLWDMHGHFSLEDGLLNIAGGITSVRDLGSTPERMAELQEKFHSGAVIGPTTYAAAMIDGLSPYTSRNPAETQEEALALVDRFAAEGYVQVKLYSSIHPEWVPAIAERTHRHGMRLSGHVPAFMSAEQAVDAGYDEIQHINMVFLNFLAGDREDTRQQIRFNLYGSDGGKLDLNSPEVETFIELLRENDIVIDPTAAIFHSMMTHLPGQPDPTFAPIADHLPLSVRRKLYIPSFEIGEDRVEDWARTAQRQGEMVRKLHDAGIQLVPGSDDMAAFTIHSELELYHRYGIPNTAVLRIATLDSARVLGVDDQTGSIDPGKAADLVLLDGNPLEDISALRRGLLVMKGGLLYQPDALYRAAGVEPFLDSIEL